MIRRMLAALSLLALTSTWIPSPTPALAEWQADGTVVAILDSETVVVRFPGTYGATMIRLIGVQVPKGDECGSEAMMVALDALVMGKVVTVEFDRNGPLQAEDGAVRAFVWLGAELAEDYTVQELAEAHAQQSCAVMWIRE